jgi:hypothetical protein
MPRPVVFLLFVVTFPAVAALLLVLAIADAAANYFKVLNQYVERAIAIVLEP